MIYPALKALLFRLDPEFAHSLTFNSVALLSSLPGYGQFERAAFAYGHPSLETEVCGLHLDNPVGLAAGFDKNGALLDSLLGLGFGAVEMGTVTPRAQVGNPRPRLFRLPESLGLINRMGFNNAGVEALAGRLRAARRNPGAVGVNLGKQKETPLADAAQDYIHCLGKVYDFAGYAVINISSPNTPGLRELQGHAYLANLMQRLVAERDTLAEKKGRRVPLLFKIAPDLDDEELAEVVTCSTEQAIDGLIATNTTTARPGIDTERYSESGGLSGAPLQESALRCVSEIYRLSGGKLPIFGVGGISTGADAYSFIRAGASFVQIYSGLIYEGPLAVKRIKQSLVALLARDGVAHVSDAVGAAHRA